MPAHRQHLAFVNSPGFDGRIERRNRPILGIKPAAP
jgi:hypothetical protein